MKVISLWKSLKHSQPYRLRLGWQSRKLSPIPTSTRPNRLLKSAMFFIHHGIFNLNQVVTVPSAESRRLSQIYTIVLLQGNAWETKKNTSSYSETIHLLSLKLWQKGVFLNNLCIHGWIFFNLRNYNQISGWSLVFIIFLVCRLHI